MARFFGFSKSRGVNSNATSFMQIINAIVVFISFFILRFSYGKHFTVLMSKQPAKVKLISC